MPPSSQLSPLQASELLGIHANTVRLWWVAVSVGVAAGIVLGVILAVLLRP